MTLCEIMLETEKLKLEELDTLEYFICQLRQLRYEEKEKQKMKFVIYKTDDDDYSNFRVLNFNTVEQLIAFQKREKYPIIIGENDYLDEKILVDYYEVSPKKAKAIAECEYSIEIYNDYRE